MQTEEELIDIFGDSMNCPNCGNEKEFTLIRCYACGYEVPAKPIDKSNFSWVAIPESFPEEVDEIRAIAEKHGCDRETVKWNALYQEIKIREDVYQKISCEIFQNA